MNAHDNVSSREAATEYGRNHVRVSHSKQLSRHEIALMEGITGGSYLGTHDGTTVFETRKTSREIAGEFALLNERGMNIQEATFVTFSLSEGNTQERHEEIVRFLGNVVKTTKDALGQIIKCITPKYSRTFKTWKEEYDPKTGRLLRRSVVHTETRIEFGDETCELH